MPGLPTAEEILAAFTANGVPAAEVRDPARRGPRPAGARRARRSCRWCTRGTDAVAELSGDRRADPVLRRRGSALDRPAPQLGEHNDHVLRELLGYSAEQIAALRAEAVI